MRLVTISPAMPSSASPAIGSCSILSSGSTVTCMAERFELRAQRGSVGLGPGDEHVHQAVARKKSGPARCSNSAAVCSPSRIASWALPRRAARMCLRAVGREDLAAHAQRAAAQLGETGDRRAARAFELRQIGALGGDAQCRRRVVQWREQPRRRVVVGADLDADGALRHGRQHDVGRHRLR